MTGEIRNPAKLPTELYPAEEKFVRCLAGGEPCIIGDGAFPKKGIESGEGANVVRSEVIRFFAFGGNEKNPVLGPEICLQGAWISESLNLTHARIPYALMLINCHFAASVSMQYAKCAALYLNGSRLAEGLHADGLTTIGNMYFRDGFFAEGEVRLLNANIGGSLDCMGGNFQNPGGKALHADGLTTGDAVYLNGNFSAEGEMRLLGANIGGDLECADGRFHNSNGYALNADGLMTKGKVNLNSGFSAEGGVRLLGANIGGDLSCNGGKFHNPKGYALAADKLMTKGSVNLRGGFSTEGEVRLLGANIGGDLSCWGGKFHNLGGNALNADGLTTKGNVNLGEDFFAKGEVRLLGVDIGQNLDCIGGNFHNSDKQKCALIVDGGNISGGLLWQGTACKGVVSLAYARANVLVDDADSWASCKVILDGFTYNRFVNPMDASFRIDWLAKRLDRMPFSPLPYEQAAKVLFGMGHAYDARRILLEKERLQTKNVRMHWLRKVGRRLWDVFAGYGYRLRYTAAWMLGIVAVGTVIFGAADWHSNIVPTHPVVALSDGYKMQVALDGDMRPTQAAPSEYPAFNPLVFSLDVFTPSTVFHQEDSWGPRSGGGDWLDFDIDILWFLTLWYWLEVAMGWILTSMFLLSITGLLRPRQSSGERD